MRNGEWPSFIARPYVCGAIGPVDPDRLEALKAAGPRVRPALRTPEAELHSSHPLPPYYRDGRSCAFAWGERRPTAFTSWISAAETYETPGLIDDGERVTLHAGGLGLVDVYYLVDGATVYFSSLLAPLLTLARRPYTIDWAAWASIVRMTFPLGDGTPYAQVRRLAGSSALVHDRRTGRTTVERRAPRWVREEPYETGLRAGELLAILHETFKEFEHRPLLVPVSGGYDSRLLCAVAVERGADVESWTTSPDEGTDADVAFARAITRELGVRHRVIEQDPAGYPADALEVARRLEWITPHHAWYAPLARELRGTGRTLVDGLAGGALLRNSMVSETAMTSSSPRERRAALLGSLSLGKPSVPFLSQAAAEWMEQTVRDSFTRATSMLHGHRAELTLSVLHTRTVRAIARSPVNLAGPETPVALPFTRPEFFDAALSIGVARKGKGRFYRELLHAANPRIASLPSTNVIKQPLTRVPLRSASAPARAFGHRMLTAIAERVPSLLSAELHETVARGPDALARFNGWHDRFWVRGLVLFGAWLREYEEALGDLTPPWEG